MEITLPFGRTATIRGLTGREEDVLADPKKHKNNLFLYEILTRCTLALELRDGTTATPAVLKHIEDLLAPDRAALLFAIRTETFGPEVDCEVTCTSCGSVNHFQVDLSAMENVPAPETGEGEVEHTLSDGTVVAMRHLNGPQERTVAQATTDRITTGMATRLTRVAGVHTNDIRKWLLDMPAKLRRELHAAMAATSCGPKDEHTGDCAQCGTELTFAAMVQSGFFFP